MKSITGAWKLVKFEIVSKDGVATPWGKNANGLLIYDQGGQMSVSINKDVENDPDQTAEQNLFDSILFYSGSYAIDGSTIRHQVTNASNPARIGKEMIRYAECSGDEIKLTTPEESFGRAVLVWKKV